MQSHTIVYTLTKYGIPLYSLFVCMLHCIVQCLSAVPILRGFFGHISILESSTHHKCAGKFNNVTAGVFYVSVCPFLVIPLFYVNGVSVHRSSATRYISSSRIPGRSQRY